MQGKINIDLYTTIKCFTKESSKKLDENDNVK